MSANPYEASRVPEPLAMPSYPASGTPNEIEFELTLEDYVAFCLDHSERTFAMRFVRLAAAFTAVLAIVFGVASYLITTPTDATIAAFLIVWAVVCVIAITGLTVWWNRYKPTWATRWYIRWHATRGDTSNIFGRYRIVLAPGEIYERMPKSESRHDISVVQRVIVTPNHAFIYVSPIQAFFIPRRAFAPAETFDAFIHTLESYSGVKPDRT